MVNSASKIRECHDADEVVVTACRLLLDDDTTVHSRLDAIEVLGSVFAGSDLDAVISALLHGVSLIGLSRSIHVVDRLAGIPAGGEVAGAAARALARLPNSSGLQALATILFDPERARPLREAAAFGLGGCTKPEAFAMYRRAVLTADSDVRFRVLVSLRESLHKIIDVEADEIRALLRSLAVVFISRASTVEGSERDLWVSILARFGGGTVDELLSPILVAGIERPAVMAAFEVLRRRRSEQARRSLVQALASHSRPLQLYQGLMGELATTGDDDSRLAALGTLRRYPIHLQLKSFVLRRERVRREIHVHAARAVLGNVR